MNVPTVLAQTINISEVYNKRSPHLLLSWWYTW